MGKKRGSSKGQAMRVLCVAFAVLAFGAAVGAANEDGVTMLEDSDVLAMLDEEIISPKTTVQVEKDKVTSVEQIKADMTKQMEAKINEVKNAAEKKKTVIIKKEKAKVEAQKVVVKKAKAKAQEDVAAAKKKAEKLTNDAVNEEKKVEQAEQDKVKKAEANGG